MRCKPNQRAFIKRGVNGPTGPNVGKVVTTVALDNPPHTKYGPVWIVKSEGSEILNEHGIRGPIGHVPDDWLDPIPDDPLPPEDTSNDAPVDKRILEEA